MLETCCQLAESEKVWPHALQLLKSRLILVGIANSLDLTERLLPGLEARGCKPRLVAFPTYTRNQICTVLQERLQALPGPVFAAKALEFCARKVGYNVLGSGFMVLEPGPHQAGFRV